MPNIVSSSQAIFKTPEELKGKFAVCAAPTWKEVLATVRIDGCVYKSAMHQIIDEAPSFVGKRVFIQKTKTGNYWAISDLSSAYCIRQEISGIFLRRIWREVTR